MKALVWFRKALRIHDNYSLHHAIEGADQVFLLYIINPDEISQMSNNSLIILYETLLDLSQNLFKQYNATLIIQSGNPLEVLPSFIVQYGICRMYTDKPIDPASEAIEKSLKPILTSLGIYSRFAFSNTLYDLDFLLKSMGENLPTSFEGYVQHLRNFIPPASPLSSPESIPHSVSKEDFPFPPIESFGIKDYRTTSNQPPCFGGETKALTQLKSTIGDVDWVKKFEQGDTNPTSITPSTSLLSPYFAFGSLSPKIYHAELHSTYRKIENRGADFSTILLKQILWREYFMLLSYSYPNFDQIEGNPLCRQLHWLENNEHLELWREGKTGYPFIDAIISCLIKTGWVHHLARHLIACFLTRGDLWLSWIHGRDFMRKYAIDYDWSLNNANWIWMSGSGLEGSIMLVYNPVEFGKQYDPEGNFIRHYLPILKKFPKEYIYEPWKAPLDIQRNAGCIVGEDYPERVVDHDAVLKENISRLRDCHLKYKDISFPYGPPINREQETTNSAIHQTQSLSAFAKKTPSKRRYLVENQLNERDETKTEGCNNGDNGSNRPSSESPPRIVCK